MPLNEDGMPPRQCFVIRVDTEEEVGNARAVLMEAMLVCDEKPIIYHLEICMLRLRLFESGFQKHELQGVPSTTAKLCILDRTRCSPTFNPFFGEFFSSQGSAAVPKLSKRDWDQSILKPSRHQAGWGLGLFTNQTM